AAGAPATDEAPPGRPQQQVSQRAQSRSTAPAIQRNPLLARRLGLVVRWPGGRGAAPGSVWLPAAGPAVLRLVAVAPLSRLAPARLALAWRWPSSPARPGGARPCGARPGGARPGGARPGGRR